MYQKKSKKQNKVPIRVIRCYIKQRLNGSQYVQSSKGTIIKEVKEGTITMSYQIESINKDRYDKNKQKGNP